MLWTGKMQENFKNELQRIELYSVAAEEATKVNNIKCTLFLHSAGDRSFNTLNFTEEKRATMKYACENSTSTSKEKRYSTRMICV